jgi:DNA-directed RNA polymerase specialized sigma24 family protein
VTGVESLVVRAQQGDDDAFARLIVMHFAKASATASMILGDPAAADDVVQEAMVQAWRSLPACEIRSGSRRGFGDWSSTGASTTDAPHAASTTRSGGSDQRSARPVRSGE